ncbi:MAG: AIR synthase-related protein, partial [Flavitalea sp.]
SPTRTYAPLVKQLFTEMFEDIYGVIHCSGGGQTKCMKYLPGNMKVVKNNLFEAPEIFKLIKEASGAENREMYQVFNMGHRLEVFTNEKSADRMISISRQLGIDASIVGRVEEADKKILELHIDGETILF